MSLPEIFKDLSLDKWYKVLVYLGGVVLVLSFFLEVKGTIGNTNLQLLAGGAFLIGMGEWNNHHETKQITTPSVYGQYELTRRFRRVTPFGLLLDVIGLVLLGFAIWNIIK